MAHDSLHIDEYGQTWSIRSLLSSDRPRAQRRLSVEALWGRAAHRRCWGRDVPSPARLLARPGLGCLVKGDADPPVHFADTVEDHQARIAGLLGSIRRRVTLEPLVIGFDGRLWDGMHRLAALYLAKVPDVNVLDFSETSPLAQRESDIWSVIGPSLQMKRVTALLGERFAAGIPYRHIFLPQVLNLPFAAAIHRQFETLPWRLSSTEFYDQYEVSLLDIDYELGGTALGSLREVALGSSFGRIAEEITGISGLRVSDVACHRSCPGQQIGLHNDFSPDGEVCRWTLHFNPGWSIDEGGLFVTFAAPSTDAASAAYLPTMNSAIVFEISSASYHAVTPVAGSRDRYSLVISFVPDGL